MSPTKVLIMGSIWPQAGASAASTRVLDMVEALLEQGFQVTFSADAKEGPATDHLRAKGVACVRLAQNSHEFRDFVSQLAPDITIFDRFTTEEKFGWQVREMCPESLRILDTIDLHFVRKAREQAHLAGEKADDWRDLLRFAGDIAPREMAAIYRCDLSLVVSDAEISLLTQYASVPPHLLHLYRLTYDRPEPTVTSFEKRRGFVMIGSFRHPPNEDSVLWVKNHLWPAIRQHLPEAHVHIYGAHAQPRHLALSNPKDGFYVKGYAQDPFAIMSEARVNLAPLRFGAGIKGKIADGWWCGTPVVTTSIGAEGMHEDLPCGGLVREVADDLVTAAVTLYQDQAVWEASSRSALDIMTQLYTREMTAEPFIKRLTWLLANREHHRLSNFTGEILWQQGLRATEYFSRWIELKNKAAPTEHRLESMV